MIAAPPYLSIQGKHQAGRGLASQTGFARSGPPTPTACGGGTRVGCLGGATIGHVRPCRQQRQPAPDWCIGREPWLCRRVFATQPLPAQQALVGIRSRLCIQALWHNAPSAAHSHQRLAIFHSPICSPRQSMTRTSPHDRRSGKDRRESDQGPPDRFERRRSVEPRQPEVVELELSEEELRALGFAPPAPPSKG